MTFWQKSPNERASLEQGLSSLPPPDGHISLPRTAANTLEIACLALGVIASTSYLSRTSLMADAYFYGPTLDDVMHDVIEAIQSHGERICPGKGAATELAGVLLEVTNPRARLSRTEVRGKPFSCLGELCWYLAGSNGLEFI